MENYIAQCVIRRQKVLDKIGTDGVAVIYAAPERRRSNDTYYPYRQDSNFFYLTGFNEPDAVLVLDGLKRESILFCRDKDPQREIWDGLRCGVANACGQYRMDKSYDIEQFKKRISGCLKGHKRLFFISKQNRKLDKEVLRPWFSLQTKKHKPQEICADLQVILRDMRLIKDAVELDFLRQAAKISAAGHIQAMKSVRPDMWEYQIEGLVLSAFFQHGARNPAYNTIVAGGKNACILHYIDNQDKLKNGDVLMMDAGAEWHNYAGDISRSFPVNGKFSPAQKAVYEVVLATNKAVINAVKAGVAYEKLHKLSEEMLTQGLIDLKLLSGSLNILLKKQAFRRFYMHGIGHWLGLDVHDVDERKALQTNMCLTVEPGLYIPDEPDIPPEFRGIGIRIEDNVIVGENACEVYTADAPKEIDEIETLMAG